LGEKKLSCPILTQQSIYISKKSVSDENGMELTRSEQTFVYIRMANGGTAFPSGEMKSFKEFPNTVSKIKSMNDSVENPLGEDIKSDYESPDLAYHFHAFPKVPIILLF
jgi:hypothetical protein